MLRSQQGWSMFMFEETRPVPVQRLLSNLEQRLAENTNDFEVTYQLARLHSMAYATNLTEVDVTKKEGRPVFEFPPMDSGVPRTVAAPGTAAERQAGLSHLTNAILLYERAILLLKRSTNLDEQRWLILPVQLGLAWCLDQAGRRDQAIRAYRVALKYSWKFEVTGDFKIQEWVKDVWNDVRAGKNPLRPHNRGYLGPGVCYSEEIIGYLLKLLDPVKDASEIGDLKKAQQTLTSMGRAITPILVPLGDETDLAELVDPAAAVQFDLDGSGLARRWGWITPKAAWLVWDPDGRGQITSGLQLFGNATFWVFWRDGYAALSALDDNGDGVLSGEELRGLALWSDRNGNGLSDPGEVLPLSAYGIVSLTCREQVHPTGIQWAPMGVTFTNGTSRPSYDWIAPSRATQATTVGSVSDSIR
jgi:hypothetical protein